MSCPKDLKPTNAEGIYHGCCESYWNTGELKWKGIYINGGAFGYHRWYHKNGDTDNEWSGYYFDGGRNKDDTNEIGYCYTWNKVIL